MEQYISLFIIIPLLGFLANTLTSKDDEVRLSQVSFVTMGLQFLATLVFTIRWAITGAETLYKKQITLLRFNEFDVYIDFKYNSYTAVFLLVGAFIAFLITAYSRNYLHREKGFKRFFTTILFFYLGYNTIVLSGNLTTIFVGWEIAGISSFLLIAYYRNRYIPVKNAIKIFSIYRLGDISIMLAMWLSHHIWHKNISLFEFQNTDLVTSHINNHTGTAIGFSLCIFVAAAIKSAQFPFSAWLSRAMEGPTPSSAIFYSSLAVHLGVLVLLRTYEFWSLVPYMTWVLIALGGTTFLLGTITSRIQPSIKGQIAYSVVAQVGLMFIEVALGWHTLVVIHFASHAMLRSYQLLISPSIVSYSIKEQFYNFTPVKRLGLPPFLRNISNSIYILSLNEWYMDGLMYKMVWGPFKWMGQILQHIPKIYILNFLKTLVLTLPFLVLAIRKNVINLPTYPVVLCIVIIAFATILLVFTEKEKVINAWIKVAFFHLLIIYAMYLHGMNLYDLSFYFGGVTIAYLLGQLAIDTIRKKEKTISLHGYQGHCYEYPTTEFLFLTSALGLMGFPITSAFLGSELILSGAQDGEYTLLAILLMSFLVNGLSMIRIYTRVFLGPHVKTYHESARKTS